MAGSTWPHASPSSVVALGVEPQNEPPLVRVLAVDPPVDISPSPTRVCVCFRADIGAIGTG